MLENDLNMIDLVLTVVAKGRQGSPRVSKVFGFWLLILVDSILSLTHKDAAH